MAKLDDFWLDGEAASDHGVVCQKTITFDAPEPQVENIRIAGRSGDIIYWDGSYRNVRGKARCYCLDTDVPRVMEAVNAWLMKSADYRRLETLHDREFFRMARLVRGAAWDARLGILNPFELEFDCDPRKYYRSGERGVELDTSGTTIYGPSSFPAKPLITVHGSSSGTLTVGSVTLTLTNCDELVLDCEKQDATRNGENANGAVSGSWPVLGAETEISWTGGVTGVTVVPRWWSL